MRVGFTGTEVGMTYPQSSRVYHGLEYFRPQEVHHGDCIGADAAFHDLARLVGNVWIVVHPPDNPAKRAFKLGDASWVEKPYLDRNTDIVSCSDVLIAAPLEYEEILRSGTWSTVRRARKADIPIYIIFPDGSMKIENETSVFLPL